jgi:hypothetical protein
MRSERKFVLPLLATAGLISLLFQGKPNWETLPQRAANTKRLAVPPVPKDQLVFGSIDNHDERWQVHGKYDSVMETYGWVASTRADDPVKTVDLLVDGQVVATAPISFPRPDIAADYGRPDFNMSGWRTFIPLQGIPAGEHKLGLQATTASGKKGDLPPLKLFVSE